MENQNIQTSIEDLIYVIGEYEVKCRAMQKKIEYLKNQLQMKVEENQKKTD